MAENAEKSPEAVFRVQTMDWKGGTAQSERQSGVEIINPTSRHHNHNATDALDFQLNAKHMCHK